MIEDYVWREDVEALAFRFGGRDGFCVVHRHAFRTLLRRLPSEKDCSEFFIGHRETFEAAACAKVLRAKITDFDNFHITSRDVLRQMRKSGLAPTCITC
ncbi:hypothetical protein NP284_07670 [Rhodopseudomonas pseudopalustris]|uniref:DUF1488 domain-containing protein n=1 Tax=Rhodopseudomonas pseudopalustris TaxID=1513892 RepID=A0A1H8LUD2_9BRAD|nr:hypothetical protein SAMN05444123_101227 [Rhodopseudomonas pseudopalustris]